MKLPPKSASRRTVVAAGMLLCSPVTMFAQNPKPVRIGVIRAAAIGALELNQQGFEAALAGAGLKPGVDVTYDIRNTGGDSQVAQNIVQQFIDDKADLIHSMGTGPTLAAIRTPRQIPVVFSAVTDPVGSGVVPAGGTVGKPTGIHVTGVSDRWPIALQLETYARMVPQARIWGTMYNPGEANSVVQVGLLRDAASRLGIHLIEQHVNTTSEVRAAASKLAARVQAIFVVSDATVNADMLAVQEASDQHRIPNFTGVALSVQRGALAAFGVDYFLVGYAAGKKAALVLRGVAVGQIPWNFAEHFGLVLNQKAARALGITFPAEMLRLADKVVE